MKSMAAVLATPGVIELQEFSVAFLKATEALLRVEKLAYG